LPKQDIELAVVQADPAAGGFILGTEQNASGQTLEGLQREMAARNAESTAGLSGIADSLETTRPLDLTSASQNASTSVQGEEEEVTYEQMPAPIISAVMDLERIRIRQQHENRGDEYYLVTFLLRGRLGEGPRIATFDYSKQVWPLGSGDNWAEKDRVFTIPQGAGRIRFEDLKPFEVYGFVGVLMEANNNSVQERTWAFGFGEFQNESGVTEVVQSAFDRAVPRESQAPDYSDTSCSNVMKIFFENIEGLTRQFGDYRLRNSGLSSAIQDAIDEPLKRSGRDIFDGAMWSFYMNVPGGDRCISYPTEGPVYVTPGSELSFDTFSTTVYGKHSQ
jgi:hypothetical protein